MNMGLFRRDSTVLFFDFNKKEAKNRSRISQKNKGKTPLKHPIHSPAQRHSTRNRFLQPISKVPSNRVLQQVRMSIRPKGNHSF
jgi:hypothetical protein